MSSPEWEGLAEDDLDRMLRTRVREQFRQVEPAAGGWERLREKLEPRPQQRSFWRGFWSFNVLPMMSGVTVAALALLVAIGFAPMRTTTLVTLYLAPLRAPQVLITYETAAPAVRPVKRLARRHDPTSFEQPTLALAAPLAKTGERQDRMTLDRFRPAR
jgi:hypothetical protein